MPRRAILTAALAVVASSVALVVAGPLDPPAGPITSSNKTLAEVEPRIAVNQTNTPGSVGQVFHISKPGSYYLTGDVVVPAGKSGIGIVVPHVTLDLNGFSIVGDPGSTDAITNAGAGITSVIIRNGFVQGGQNAIKITAGYTAIVEDISILGAPETGIWLPGGAVVRNCVVHGCKYGFQVGVGSLVENCVAGGCTLHGFTANARTTFRSCRSDGNDVHGFQVGSGCSLTDCHASQNTHSGFALNDSCTLDHCDASNNVLDGFTPLSGCRLDSCTATGNGGAGFRLSDTCSLIRAQARNNGGNTDAGIVVGGIGARVEDCESTSNFYGIYVGPANTANVVVRNSCRGNAGGNFAGGWINASNDVAPIVTNPGVSGYSTMTPWSNISY